MIPQGCTPLLVLVNVRSGGQQGMDLIRSFRKLLNPHQVYDLMNGGPLPGSVLVATALDIICNSNESDMNFSGIIWRKAMGLLYAKKYCRYYHIRQVSARVAKLVLKVHLGKVKVIGSAMVTFDRAMVVSYMLSIVAIALSLTIWLHFLPLTVS